MSQYRGMSICLDNENPDTMQAMEKEELFVTYSYAKDAIQNSEDKLSAYLLYRQFEFIFKTLADEYENEATNEAKVQLSESGETKLTIGHIDVSVKNTGVRYDYSSNKDWVYCNEKETSVMNAAKASCEETIKSRKKIEATMIAKNEAIQVAGKESISLKLKPIQ